MTMFHVNLPGCTEFKFTRISGWSFYGIHHVSFPSFSVQAATRKAKRKALRSQRSQEVHLQMMYTPVFPNIAGWNITIFNRKYIFNPGPPFSSNRYVRLAECTYRIFFQQNVPKTGRNDPKGKVYMELPTIILRIKFRGFRSLGEIFDSDGETQ